MTADDGLGEAYAPPEAPTDAAYQAARATLAPVAAANRNPSVEIVTRWSPMVSVRTIQVLLAIAACDVGGDGVIRGPSLRQLAARTARSVCSVRGALVRLERAQALVVTGGSKGEDGTFTTNTYRITVGPWAHRWKPPGIVRQVRQETFDRRNVAMPDRRPALEARTGETPERAQVSSPVPQERAQERAQEARTEVRSTSRGGARRRATPTCAIRGGLPGSPEYEEHERLLRSLTDEYDPPEADQLPLVDDPPMTPSSPDRLATMRRWTDKIRGDNGLRPSSRASGGDGDPAR